MKLLGAGLLACALAIAGIEAYAADEIGLYFGTTGYVNCLPDSARFPFAVDARFVLCDPSYSGGLGGWECALSLPPSIVLTAADLGAGSLNVATPPEYMVGYSSPVNSSQDVTLAVFHLLVLGPGAIRLHAPERGSIAGFWGCTVVAADADGTLIPARYAFGGPVDAVATIGVPECPLPPASVEVPEFGNLPIEQSGGMPDHFVENYMDQDTAKSSDETPWQQLWLNSDLCTRGIVTAIETGCYLGGEYPAGVTGLTIAPTDICWGPERPSYTVWVEGVDVPDCACYGPNSKFALAESLDVGDELIVVASLRDNVLWSQPWRVFGVAGDAPNAVSAADISKLRTLAGEVAWTELVQSADAIALLAPHLPQEGPEDRHQFDVLDVLKGRSIVDQKIVSVSFPYGYAQFVGKDHDRMHVLMFLREGKDNLLELSNGARSVLLVDGKETTSLSGMPIRIFQ